MDFFTKTVDSSLWSSRAFEDPEYDEDEREAALSRAPITTSLTISPSTVSTLIVACGHDASLVLSAAMKLAPVGQFEADGLRIPLRSTNGIASINVQIADSRAALLASTALNELKPKRTLLITSVARWACRGCPNPGISWMRTAKAPHGTGEIFGPPSFLDGAAAAFVAQADLDGYDLSAAVLVKEEISASYGDLLDMYKVVTEFVPQPRADWVTGEAQFEAEARRNLKAERATESAMFM